MSDRRFWRGEYMRAVECIGVLLVIEALDYLVTVHFLSEHGGIGVGSSALFPWLWIWEALTALACPILGLVVARSLLTFLREQHGLSVPRWGWRAYVACVLASLLFVFDPLLTVLIHDGPLAPQLADPALRERLYAAVRALDAVSMAAGLVIDALLIGLFARALGALRRRMEPVLAAIVAFLGLVAVKNVLGDGLDLVMQYGISPGHAYSMAFITALNTFESGYSLFTIVMMAALLGLFVTLRRPDASPAAGRS